MRFDFARRSKFCNSGLGICTMKDHREADEELKRLQESYDEYMGIYNINSIVAPINPVDNFEGGTMYVVYDVNELKRNGYLKFEVKVQNRPTSTPQPLIIEDTLYINDSTDTYALKAGTYNFDYSLGNFGGYTFYIEKI